MAKYLTVKTQVPNRLTANDTQTIEELQKTEKTLTDRLQRKVDDYPEAEAQQTEILQQLKDAWAKFDISKNKFLSETHEDDTALNFDLEELEELLDKIENFQFGQ